MKAKFNFNTHQLAAGSRIVNAHGRTLYTVVKALTPAWETPDSNYENDCLWVQVIDNEGQEWAQPVQWFNAVIGANEGMHVVQGEAA